MPSPNLDLRKAASRVAVAARSGGDVDAARRDLAALKLRKYVLDVRPTLTEAQRREVAALLAGRSA